MPLTNTAATDVLKMISEGIDPSWRAATTFYVALFTADPTLSGSFTAEANYTGYARIPLVKDAEFNTVGNVSSNANLVQFGLCTAGTNTITHFAICTALTGGTMLQFKALNASINISAGIEPKFSAGSITVTAS